VFPIAVNVITFVLGAILCIMLSWELFIVYIICIGLVVLVFPPLQVALSRRSTRNLRNAQTALYSRAADCVQGLVDWRLSGRVSDFSQRLREPFEAALASLRHSSRINRVISIASQALFAIFVAVIAWWATCAFAPNVVEGGAHTVWSATAFARGIATTSDSQGFAYAANWITAFVLAAFPLFEHFASTAPAAADLDFRHPSLKDLREIETFQPSALVGVTESTCRSQATPTGAAAITMDSVTFTFPNSTRSVFNNLSLTIAPGAHVAVVGRSGVGKTTLVRLIAGELVPCRGSVRVANCNPHIARNVAVVEQVPHIFNTTLRENLLVANGRATDTQIEDALRAVGLESLLERSGGLASLLVLDGANVSGGQRQRIALARALVSAAPVVVLDEPFAAIDPDLELRLLDTIKHAFKGRTLICVTHHTDNLAFFDQVIELHS
jgi:ATP-binding cassette subfamily C protein CydC